jgi:hypothetical protein
MSSKRHNEYEEEKKTPRRRKSSAGSTPPQTSKFYCGDKELPIGYDRYGSRYQCLRRGVGVGLYVLAPQRRNNISEKKDYDQFLEDNFEKAKRQAKTGDIFKQLAILWKLERDSYRD